MTAPEVLVEVHLANGLPSFTIVYSNTPVFLFSQQKCGCYDAV
jgi:hypothetical protein